MVTYNLCVGCERMLVPSTRDPVCHDCGRWKGVITSVEERKRLTVCLRCGNEERALHTVYCAPCLSFVEQFLRKYNEKQMARRASARVAQILKTDRTVAAKIVAAIQDAGHKWLEPAKRMAITNEQLLARIEALEARICDGNVSSTDSLYAVPLPSQTPSTTSP